jgi:hypothetical protein
MRINEESVLRLLIEQANNITEGLSNNTPANAISNSQYKACGLSNLIGKVPQFFDLGNMSDIVHVPIPFLEECHFIKLNDDDDDSVCYAYLVRDNARKKKLIEQRDVFKFIFSKIVDNIIKLIDYDSPPSSGTRNLH